MVTPKLATHVPMGKDIRHELLYGDEDRNRTECLVFVEDIRTFRKTYRDSQGVWGQTFHNWKSSEHQRGLDEMTDAYLDTHGRGPMFWPDDPILPYYSSLQYSQHRSFIRQQIRQLFFRLNLSHYRTAKYKDARGKSHESLEPIVVDSQSSEVDTTSTTYHFEDSLPASSVSFEDREFTAAVPSFSIDPALQLTSDEQEKAQSKDLDNGLESIEVQVPTEQQTSSTSSASSLKRGAGRSSLANPAPKRTRSNNAPESSSKATGSRYQKPHVSPSRSSPPESSVSRTHNAVTHPPSRSVETARIAGGLIVTLKVPTALPRLRSQQNKSQSTEAEPEKATAVPERAVPATSSSADSGLTGNDTQPELNSNDLNEKQWRAPEAMMEANEPDTDAALPVDGHTLPSVLPPIPPPLTATQQTPPAPKSKPKIVVTWWIVNHDDHTQPRQEWKPAEGFKNMNFVRLAKEINCTSFIGYEFRLRLKDTTFLRHRTVRSGIGEVERFEEMKQNFSREIVLQAAEAKPGTRLEFEMEIEPIADKENKAGAGAAHLEDDTILAEQALLDW